MIDENVTMLTFNISNFNGPRLKFYKEEIRKFIKIEYPGLHLKSIFTDIVNFYVDNKLIRKLKLLNVSGKIKHNSKEELILNFIEKSNIIDNTEGFSYPDYWYNSDYSRVLERLIEEENESTREERVVNNKYKSKMCSQKLKQYNNNRNYRI